MFEKIMTPVDLLHQDGIEKALQCTADLAKRYDAQVVYVGVAGSAPSELAHNPKEYSEKLATFTSQQASKHGISATSHVKHCNDITTDLDDGLLEAIRETKADLVVMQKPHTKLERLRLAIQWWQDSQSQRYKCNDRSQLTCSSL